MLTMQDTITDWWTKITTMDPKCIYYFGPFSSYDEARVAYPGYIEDLSHEGAKGIIVVIQRCEPDALTICDEATD
jgi:Domain of unknown function (DUF1816)